MLTLSLVFHVAIFSLVFLVPANKPVRKIKGSVYEVDLVELPRGKQLSLKAATKTKSDKKLSVYKKASGTKLVSRQKKKAKRVNIAKRALKKKGRKSERVEKPEPLSSSRLIEQAVAKIEGKLKTDKKGSPTKDTLKPGNEAKEIFRGGSSPGDGSGEGITFRIYRLDVENRIKSNWSYPVALTSLKKQKDLETIVVLKVKKDGKIIRHWVNKKSRNIIFDQSVLKAIERSNPLPPFPEGYRKTFDEIEINFNLRNLERH